MFVHKNCGQLAPNSLVATTTRPVLTTHPTSEDVSFSIYTGDGFRVIGSPDHEILVASDEGPHFKRLEHIQITDYCAILRDNVPFGNDEISESKAHAYGILYCLQIHPDLLKGKTFQTWHGPIQLDHHQIIEKWMPNLQDEDFAGAIGKIGCTQKKFPREILGYSFRNWIAFLQGVFDICVKFYDDKVVRVRLQQISSVQKRIVQEMLSAWGVLSRQQPSHLRIHNASLDRLLQNIHIKAAENIATSPKPRDIVPVSSFLIRDLIEENRGKLSKEFEERLVSYAAMVSPISRIFLEPLLEDSDPSPSCLTLRRLARKDLHWVKVSKTISGKHKLCALPENLLQITDES